MMMKVLLFSITILMCFYCNDIRLEIGFELPTKYTKCNKKENKDCKKQLFRTYANKYEPFLRKEIDNVEYVIGYNEKSNQITFINTSDLRFRTKKGLKVGSELELTKDQVHKIPEWEIYAPTDEEGWKPVIGYDEPEVLINGEIIFPGDPTKGFETSDKIKVKVISFSKTL